MQGIPTWRLTLRPEPEVLSLYRDPETQNIEGKRHVFEVKVWGFGGSSKAIGSVCSIWALIRIDVSLPSACNLFLVRIHDRVRRKVN